MKSIYLTPIVCLMLLAGCKKYSDDQRRNINTFLEKGAFIADKIASGRIRQSQFEDNLSELKSRWSTLSADWPKDMTVERDAIQLMLDTWTLASNAWNSKGYDGFSWWGSESTEKYRINNEAKNCGLLPEGLKRALDKPWENTEDASSAYLIAGAYHFANVRSKVALKLQADN